MESQLEINEERLKLLETFNQELPDLMVPESAKWDVVYLSLIHISEPTRPY